MSAVALAIGSGVAGIAGAVIGSGASGHAADVQSQAASQAAQIQADATRHAADTTAAASGYATDIANQQFWQNQHNIQPWIQSGQWALGQMGDMASKPVSFTASDFANNMDPAYKFNLDQGSQALQRSAAASGKLMSGGTLKDLTTYAQGQASNEYGNAYNRFMNNQNTQFNRLASMSGSGQVGAGQLGAAGSSMAANIGNIATGTAGALSGLYTGGAAAQGGYLTGAANAQAGSSIAQGNAWSGALNGAGNSAMTAGFMNHLLPTATSGLTPGGGGSASSMSFMTPSQQNYWGSNPYSGGAEANYAGYTPSIDTAFMAS